MRIALIGARGQIGQHIAQQLLQAGHQVTALLRPGAVLPAELAGAQAREVDILGAQALAEAVRGHDAVASAYGPAMDAPQETVAVMQALMAACRASVVRRLVVVGGAGSLEVAPGVQLVDTPAFPQAYHALASAHRDALTALRQAQDLDWTFFAPAALIQPGERLGGYQLGVGSLLCNAAGESRIHYPDYAEAFVAELTGAGHPRQILTVAYS